VLVALTLASRVEGADGRIVVRDPAPLGDPNLDEALARLTGLREVPVAKWMADIPAGSVTAYFERLEAAGVLRSEMVWLLFIARRQGYRLVDPAYFENLRAALHAAVTGTGPVEPGVNQSGQCRNAGNPCPPPPGRSLAQKWASGQVPNLWSVRADVFTGV
jgi:hypothetical protein